MIAPAVLAHHSEPTDPELLTWLVHNIDATVGRDPLTLVLAIAVVVLSLSVLLLLFFVIRMRRLKRPPGRWPAPPAGGPGDDR